MVGLRFGEDSVGWSGWGVEEFLIDDEGRESAFGRGEDDPGAGNK